MINDSKSRLKYEIKYDNLLRSYTRSIVTYFCNLPGTQKSAFYKYFRMLRS